MRRYVWRWLAASACLLLDACVAPAVEPPIHADLLFQGGVLVDGTGAPRRRADVAVSGDRIVFVGLASEARVRAQRVIQVENLFVAPGFIDPHTHSLTDLESDDPSRRLALNHLTQGVTTILIGNDGGGAFDVAAQRTRLESRGIGVNVASFVGFGRVREAVLGEASRAPDGAELARMRGLVAQAMCEGAVGLSSGLYYAPQSFASTEEVIVLAREAALRGGVYDTHLRDEGSDNIGLIAAVAEALEIGREAGIPVHIAHIKALGVDVHGQSGRVIEMIEAERAVGARITADQYPWSASGTGVVSALMPRWTQEGGEAAMHRRLQDRSLASRLQIEIADNIRRRGGAASLLVTSGPMSGLTLEQAAAQWNIEPWEAARDIALSGSARLASFNMDEADIRAFMQREWVMTSSDSSAGHPRRVGSFPRKFAEYVRTIQLLSVEQFVQRSSALAATTFGLQARGAIRAGNFADIVVFSPERFAARATYQEPDLASVGVEYLVINGALAIDRGEAQHVREGRVLAHSPPPETCPETAAHAVRE